MRLNGHRVHLAPGQLEPWGPSWVLTSALAWSAIAACERADSQPPAPSRAPAPSAAAEHDEHPPSQALTVAETPKSPVTPAPPSATTIASDPSAYVGRHVLLPEGTVLRTAPRNDATKVTLQLNPRKTVTVTRGVKVVAHDGEFIGVRAAAERDRCSIRSLPGLDALDVTLWIRPDALAPVLDTQTTVTGSDGDRATLWPGTAIDRGDPMVAEVGGLTLAVTLDASAIATSYAPIAPPEIADEAVELLRGAPIRWNGKDLWESTLLSDSDFAFPAARIGDEPESVTVWSRCAEITGRVDAKRERRKRYRKRNGILAAMGTNRADTVTWVVAKGTPVLWTDGTTAGTTTKRRVFETEPRTIDGRSCVSTTLAESSYKDDTDRAASRLELCFATDSVTRVDPAPDPFSSPGFGAGLAGPRKPR